MAAQPATNPPSKSPQPPSSGPSADSQHERWLKYGTNVVVAVVAAVILAGLVVYIAQKQMFDFRHDTTLNNAYSLTPQTINYIKDLNAPVKLVSLYTHRKNEEVGQQAIDQRDYARAISDLLDEYGRDGKNITIEKIDPVNDSGKLDDLFTEVAQKYGNDTKVYAQVSDQFPDTVAQINKLAADEIKQLSNALNKVQGANSELSSDVVVTLQAVPEMLQNIQDQIQQERDLHPKTPNYNGIAAAIRTGLSGFDQEIDSVVSQFKQQQNNPKVPQALRDYMKESIPRYEAMKKPGDDLLEKMKNLGKIKQLDELRQDKSNSIVVMGPRDMKVLSFDQVWPVAEQHGPHANERRRFAGEQQITTAIIALTMAHQPKVVFIRPGGAPLTLSIDQEAPLAVVAQRLRDYNFDVMEKDVTGAWQMQAMRYEMQGYPIPPEPKDAEIADAVWIVVSDQPSITQQGPNPLSAKLQQHLAQGGSAVVLALPDADPLTRALAPWGVALHTDELAVHDDMRQQNSEATANTDPVDFISRQGQSIFVLNQYGDADLVKPLNDTEVNSVFPQMLLVTEEPVPGYRGSLFLPIPTTPRAWGTHEIEKVLNGDVVKHDPNATGDAADIAPPLYGAAAVERIAAPSTRPANEQPAQRLVVIGATSFATNGPVVFPDPSISSGTVPLFPGNGDLFCNAVLWAAHQDSMIAITPNVLDISRIARMNDGVLLTWRIIIIGGLPLLVLIAAGFMYVKRRG